jgi:DNA gyrase inhibitor GyrI
MGMFSKVSITEKKMGPYTYAYATHTGEYSGTAKTMTVLYDNMKEAGFNSVDGIGVYYDDPKTTPKEELKSDVGSIIASEDVEKIEANKDKFNFATLEEKKYLVAEFPIKNNLSYMFGPMKIYPSFNKYLEDKKVPASTKGIEYYDMVNMKIIYMMELD